MKIISNEFKEQIVKLGREIDFKFFLHTNDKILLTEDNKFLMTENNLHLIIKKFNEENINATIESEDIYNVVIVRKGKLLSTLMQEVDFEVVQDLQIGDILECNFGLKVNNDYEYINYGRFIIYSKEYNEDTKTYSYVAYDSMLLSMIEVDDRSIIENVTIKTAIENICNKVGLIANITEKDIENHSNLNNIIATDTFKDLEITYRDVLDSICQCLGVNMITNDQKLYFKVPTEIEEETKETEGLNITLENIVDGKINNIVLKGNIYQKSYSGKNLFDYISNIIANNYGLTNTINEDGSITTTGRPTANYRPIINTQYYIDNILEDGETYTISQSEANSRLYLQIVLTNKSTSAVSYLSLNTVNTRTFTVDKNTYTYRIIIQTGTTNSWGTSARTFTQWYQLEKSESATDFEKYVGGTSSPNPDFPQDIEVVTGLNEIVIENEDSTESKRYEIDLGNIELCKIEDYQDYIYSENDKYYKMPNILKIDSYNGETIITNYISTTGQLTTGATVYYVNSNPIPIEITNTELIEQLNALKNVELFNGINNITSETNNLQPYLKLNYSTKSLLEEINEEFLKDKNVKFSNKYGPITRVVLSRSEDTDIIYRRDEESIATNGLCEFKIKDNLIMLGNDREDYIDEIFNQLNGLEYYINDFNSIGITYLEPLDIYNVVIGENIYKCLLLNDEIKIQQGLEESIYTEQPEETTTNYKTSSKTDKEVSFIVDKQRGSINAKVSKGEVINEINLDESGASINADKISLTGKTIALTSDSINISSNNFNVDTNGNLNCSNANVSGTITSSNGTIGTWTIDNNGLSNTNGFYIVNKNVSGTSFGFSNIYTMSDILICSLIIQGIISISSGTPEFDHYDVNKDGQINSQDLLIIRNMMNQ